ncbi:Translin [Penicillium cf. griseofulvum]|uniref:Translin n=1 Tax=Penicillium cf. griseofulvum TaxID=2972120 RepID=A0A9W9T549_9EURO|nr:Translin [Penicillium cf. griseofulvum]KAJ5421263.1 Translin [Penicillium cf. griseofulvum]KAJ5424499.1 Translin [Penicillium cf. griseofulvum]
MGTKRSWEGQPLELNTPDTIMAEAETASAPSILSLFENFRDELDEHHDRRERIIKKSRDITALSKKIIFALQRVRTTNQPLPPKIAQENQTRFDQIHALFEDVVPEQLGINGWRYQRQISSGIQEFIEAVSFDHYLRTQTLITHAECSARVPPGILVSEEDYLMGLYDLTGEMMRFAVLSLSSGNATNATENTASDEKSTVASSQDGIVVDLRAIRAGFEALTMPQRHFMFRDMAKKQDVMQNSVEKVERAAYGIVVRGSERPSGWTPDLSGSVEVASY